MRFTFYAVSNKSYTIQFTPALGTIPWTTLTNIVSQPVDHVVVITEPFLSARRFYRLVNP